MKQFFILIYVLTVVFACSSNNTEANTEVQDDARAPGFEAFFDQFHKDSIFQIEHTNFPLEGFPAHASSNLPEDESFYWQKADWVMHKPFDIENEEYDRNFDIISETMVVETITHLPSEYRMQRRFVKYSDGWKLIYYMAMNKIK